jgi:protocatechuate 3,4-dioxygenase beta subunit
MKRLTTDRSDASGVGTLRRRELLKGSALTSIVAALPSCSADNTDPSDPIPSGTETATTSTAPTFSTTAPQANSSTPSPVGATPTQPTTGTSTGLTSTNGTSSNSSATSAPDASTGVDGSDSSSALPTEAPDETSAETSSAPPNGGELTSPAWDDVPVCQASRTDGAGQGPFFIHNDEKADDIDLFRQDIRGQYDPEAEEGTEMHLHVRILDATNASCNAAPVEGVEVYIWHTDAQGYYSGFGDPGDQKPDLPYAGVPSQNDLNNNLRFCRGAAVTDANGVVSFRSIFPGWYNGRDIHIHFLALKPGSASRGRQTYSGGDHLFTTQFYFEPSLTDSVHKASQPYLRRTELSAYEGAIKGDEAGASGLRAKATFDSGLVVAQMQILLDPKA